MDLTTIGCRMDANTFPGWGNEELPASKTQGEELKDQLTDRRIINPQNGMGQEVELLRLTNPPELLK